MTSEAKKSKNDLETSSPASTEDDGKGVIQLVGEACNFHKPGMYSLACGFFLCVCVCVCACLYACV